METPARICSYDGELLLATQYRLVDVNDHDQIEQAAAWRTELTEHGGKSAGDGERTY